MENRRAPLVPFLRFDEGMTVEAAIGRSLAMCLHPGLAWRRVRPAARVGIVLAYFSASYVTALVALLAWH